MLPLTGETSVRTCACAYVQCTCMYARVHVFRAVPCVAVLPLLIAVCVVGERCMHGQPCFSLLLLTGKRLEFSPVNGYTSSALLFCANTRTKCTNNIGT